MSYDQKCFDLAEAFLQDVPQIWTPRRTDELAKIIQNAIEGYILLEESNNDPLDPPGFEAGFCENH